MGPCLFCGCDPDVPAGDVDPAALAAAAKFKERLLDFDRTAAKRTTVIDDQEDYFSHAGDDAWLSGGEKAAAAQAHAAKEAESARARRELKLTFDFDGMSISRDKAGASAEPEGLKEGGGHSERMGDDDGPCQVPPPPPPPPPDGMPPGLARTGAKGGGVTSGGGAVKGGGAAAKGGGRGGGKGGLAASLSSVAGAAGEAGVAGDDGRGGGRGGGVGGGRGSLGGGGGAVGSGGGQLANPTLKSRPMFQGRGGGGSGRGGGPPVGEEEMAQGLQYSVCRVQHDNPWLDEMLTAELAGEGDLPGPTSQRTRVPGGASVPAGAGAALESEWTAAGTAADGGTPARAQVAARVHGGLGGAGGASEGGASAAEAAALAELDRDADDGSAYCLSMHQPWASLLVAGIKRVEGRGWPTDHRGRLWIASTAREPTELEVATVEQQYMARHSKVHDAGSGAARYDAVMALQQQVHTFPAFPTAYPPSALLGCVTVTDCLSSAEYSARDPDGEENGSAFVFLAALPRTLTVPMRISGSHKIWKLPADIATAARAALRPAGATWDAKPDGPPLGTRPASCAATPATRHPSAPPGLIITSAAAAAAAAAAATAAPPPPRLDLYGEEGEGGEEGGALGPPAAISLRADRRKHLAVLRDGVVVLRGALDLRVQQEVVDLCREIGKGPGGFYAPQTRGGSMHLQMMCLGMHWDSVTSRYAPTRTNVDGLPVPPLPRELWDLVQAAAETATEASGSIPSLRPDVCLVNFYTHGGRLGMHQDKSESADSLRRGAPVVSISIGDACDFGYSTTRPEETDASLEALGGAHKARSVRLDSGDILVFGGPSRMIFHGVTKIHANNRPKGLRMLPGRLNLTFREI